MARVDNELESLLIRKALHEKNPNEEAYWVDPDMKLDVGIHFEGKISELTNLGLSLYNVTGDVAFGTIVFSKLEDLIKHAGIISIGTQRIPPPQLDKSVPDIGANSVWARNGDNFSKYTGRGVVIGIIDTGIDFRHKNFQKPDGTSRILRLWDQTIINPIKPPKPYEKAPKAITAPAHVSLHAPLGYGVEYERDQITDTIKKGDSFLEPVRHEDVHGHGTEVAGIAAGNGQQAGSPTDVGCTGAYNYIGVAPEADLIIVRRWGPSPGDQGENLKPPQTVSAPSPSVIVDALKYIIHHAGGKPAVINCSHGLFTSVLDGTDAGSKAFDDILKANSVGNAVVFGAGNDGDSGFHAVATVGASGTELELKFMIYPDDKKGRSLTIEYVGSNLEARVISPVGIASAVPWTALNKTESSNTANGRVTPGTAGLVIVNNSANKIKIDIVPPKTGGPNPVNSTNVPNEKEKPWKIVLRNTTATPTPIHGFCLNGSPWDFQSPKFLDHVTTESTLTEDACCREAVTVGSYQVGGQLAKSSARGPAFYPAALNLPGKPDLCAPGEGISTTAIAKEREGDTCKNCCCQCCQDWYITSGGTSLAAPHVTGTIALMLHKNPTLTHTKIKADLRLHANGKPGDAPPADTPGWGSGKVSALNVVSATQQVNAPVPFVAVPEQARTAILEQFLSTEFGTTYYKLGQKYFHEILNLINKNRRVATVWHRSKGPIWTRLALNAFNNPNFKIPTSVHGISFKECVEQFASMLKRFASLELLSDIERFQSGADILQKEMTIHEMMMLIGNHPLPVMEVNPA